MNTKAINFSQLEKTEHFTTNNAKKRFINAEKVFELFNQGLDEQGLIVVLSIQKKDTDIKKLVVLAKAMKAKNNVFEEMVKKTTELKKEFGTLGNENIPQQLCAILYYVHKCKGDDKIKAFVAEFIEYYKQNEKQLTHQHRRREFWNQFVFVFDTE